MADKTREEKAQESRQAKADYGTFPVYIDTPLDGATVGPTFPVGGTIGSPGGSLVSGSCTAKLFDGQILVAAGTWMSIPPSGCSWGFQFTNVASSSDEYTLKVNLTDQAGNTGQKSIGVYVSQSGTWEARTVGKMFDTPQDCCELDDAAITTINAIAGSPVYYEVSFDKPSCVQGEKDFTVVVYEPEFQRILELAFSSGQNVDVTFFKRSVDQKHPHTHRLVAVRLSAEASDEE